MSDLKARMRRWSKRIIIVLVVFVLPPAAFYFYTSWQAERELRAVLAELDSEETAWRWEDLIAARPKLEAHEDTSALVFQARGLAMPLFNKFKIYEKVLHQPPNLLIRAGDFEPFNDAMKTVQPALEEARKLNGMPTGRFQTEWGADVAKSDLETLQRSRAFIDLQLCAAAWHAHQGDLDMAIDYCRGMQHLCQSFEDEPTLIVQRVRIALQAIILHCVERVMAQGQPTPQSVEELQRAWERLDEVRAMCNGLRGERAYCHHLFATAASRWFSMEETQGSIRRARASGTLTERAFSVLHRANLKESHSWSLRHLTALLETMKLPEPERAARQRELVQETDQAPGAARSLMTEIERSLQAHRRSVALTRCMVAGLAAERFRRDHERWPKSLAELCPRFLTKVPDDPYTGAALQLRVANDGIVIYSVGPDGKQRGMRHEDIAAKLPAGIAYEFRLWNVKQRRLVDHRQP